MRLTGKLVATDAYVFIDWVARFSWVDDDGTLTSKEAAVAEDGTFVVVDFPDLLNYDPQTPIDLAVLTGDDYLLVAKQVLVKDIVTAVLEERDFEIPVQPPTPYTPVPLSGRLGPSRTGQPAARGTYSGYKVMGSWTDHGAVPPGPVQESVLIGEDSHFKFAVPPANRLADPGVKLVAKDPTGADVGSEVVAPQDVNKNVVLVVKEAKADGLQAAPEAVPPTRLRGQVVALSGASIPVGTQAVLWGRRRGADEDTVVGVALCETRGAFTTAWPAGEFDDAFANVSLTGDHRYPVDLTGAGSSWAFPSFIYLVVDTDLPGHGEGEACACNDAPPRLPDASDLINDSALYSQDIGGACVNFTTPNRTVEEFTYKLVVRTTDPDITGSTVGRSKQESQSIPATSRPRIGDNPFGATLEGLEPTRGADFATELSLAATPLMRLWPLVERLTPGRAPIGSANPVDWDADPTFYQATSVAHGHIVTMKQVWKADGYSMGDLLYSLPLAPGQKKQIVQFDWDRTEYGRRDGMTHEDEALGAYLAHNRDITDITNAQVNERMSGGSHSSTSGESGGFGIGAMFGDFLGISGGFSASAGRADSNSWQNSSRDLSAGALNNLRDSVQQAASAVRNQRTTVIQSSRQAESFRVESEVVANHNHCHAITMEYFEILRHYVIEQRVAAVQECLFVPLQVSEFDLDKLIRWADVLRNAVPPKHRRALDAAERIHRNYEGSDLPAARYADEGIDSLVGRMQVVLRFNRPRDADDDATDAARLDTPILANTILNSTGWSSLGALLGGTNHMFQAYFAQQRVRAKDQIFQDRVAPAIAEAFVRELKFYAVDANGASTLLPIDATLASTYQRDVPLTVTFRSTAPIGLTRAAITYLVVGTDVDLRGADQSRGLARSLSATYSTRHLNSALATNYALDDDIRTSPDDDVHIATPLSSLERRNPRDEDRELLLALLRHLNANLEQYHKVIWARMDPDRRYMLLDGFEAPGAAGRSLASVVENRIIGVAGNSLIMPVAAGYKLDPSYKRAATAEPDEREPQLVDHYQPLTPAEPYRISVPTRGVFAEAVQGACNSCETKDDTRFWRWEESPNPDEPTPIAPIGTSPPQRASVQLDPTPLPAPIVAFQNAPPTADPGAGLAGALALLGQSGLFPDMAGLEGTQANAVQAMVTNQQSARAYADMATKLAIQANLSKTADRALDAIQKAVEQKLITPEQASRLTESTISGMIGGGAQAPTMDGPADESVDLTDHMAAVNEAETGSLTVTRADGSSLSTTFGKSAATGSAKAGGGGGGGSMPDDEDEDGDADEPSTSRPAGGGTPSDGHPESTLGAGVGFDADDVVEAARAVTRAMVIESIAQWAPRTGGRPAGVVSLRQLLEIPDVVKANVYGHEDDDWTSPGSWRTYEPRDTRQIGRIRTRGVGGGFYYTGEGTGWVDFFRAPADRATPRTRLIIWELIESLQGPGGLTAANRIVSGLRTLEALHVARGARTSARPSHALVISSLWRQSMLRERDSHGREIPPLLTLAPGTIVDSYFGFGLDHLDTEARAMRGRYITTAVADSIKNAKAERPADYASEPAARVRRIEPGLVSVENVVEVYGGTLASHTDKASEKLGSAWTANTTYIAQSLWGRANMSGPGHIDSILRNWPAGIPTGARDANAIDPTIVDGATKWLLPKPAPENYLRALMNARNNHGLPIKKAAVNLGDSLLLEALVLGPARLRRATRNP